MAGGHGGRGRSATCDSVVAPHQAQEASQAPKKAFVVALFDFEPAAGTTELAVCQGEKLRLLRKEGQWASVKNIEGDEGYVPLNYLKEAPQSPRKR